MNERALEPKRTVTKVVPRGCAPRKEKVVAFCRQNISIINRVTGGNHTGACKELSCGGGGGGGGGGSMRLSVDWITLRVHDVGKNLALIFYIVTTSIMVSKRPHR